MKLELKHLAPYLPYGLKAINCFNEAVEVLGIQNGSDSVNNQLWIFKKNNECLKGYLYQCKPILRPLSDLTKEVNGASYMDKLSSLLNLNVIEHCFIAENITRPNFIDNVRYSVAKFLFENHFDAFNLIPQGLAIDINDLDK